MKDLAVGNVAGLRNRLNGALARGGGRYLAELIRRRLVRMVVEQFVLITYAHDGPPRQLRRPDIDIDILELDRDHLPEIAAFYGATEQSFKHATLLRRFDCGADCFGVFCNGTLATMSWGLSTPDIDRHTGFILRPGKDEVVLSDGLTLEPFRGRGLRRALLEHQLDRYYRKGKRVLIATEQTNYSMRNVIEKYSFAVIQKTRILKVLGCRFVHEDRVCY